MVRCDGVNGSGACAADDWLTPWAAEFDWTAVLRRPFADAGLEDVCTVLLR